MDPLTHLMVAEHMARERERDLQRSLGQRHTPVANAARRGRTATVRRRRLARWVTTFRPAGAAP